MLARFRLASALGAREPAKTGAVGNMMRLATSPLANLYVYAMPDGARRNPDWEQEEIILACDQVMLNGWQQIGAEDPACCGVVRLAPAHAAAMTRRSAVGSHERV
jgi:hypothetical protein